MRVFIYEEGELAKIQAENMRESGHFVSFRNAQFFKESQLENCDLVVTNDEAIKAAYESAGVKVEALLQPVTISADGKGKKK